MGRRRYESKAALLLCCISVMICLFASLCSTSAHEIAGITINTRRLVSYFQGSTAAAAEAADERRRVLVDGPGSCPPRCMSKCGECIPCIPVHLPVPPGSPVTTEYYPEAWRCKCGDKLYMP